MYVCTCRRVRRNVGSRSSDGPATLGFRRLGSGLCDLLYHMYTYLPIHLYIHAYIHTLAYTKYTYLPRGVLLRRTWGVGRGARNDRFPYTG